MAFDLERGNDGPVIGEKFGVGEIINTVNFKTAGVDKDMIEFSAIFFQIQNRIAKMETGIDHG